MKDLINKHVWEGLWGDILSVDDVSTLVESKRLHIRQRKKDSRHDFSMFIASDSNSGVLALNKDVYAKYTDNILKHKDMSNLEEVTVFLQKSGLTIAVPDNVFYGSEIMLRNPENYEDVCIRQLTDRDAESFSIMTQECTEDDLDASYVELDHDVVYGVFHNDIMLSRASAYGFDEEGFVYDIGYITHPKYLGRGYGSLCCAALAKKLFSMNKIPQIRVQPQLGASLALAKKIGFQFFGRWYYPEE